MTSLSVGRSCSLLDTTDSVNAITEHEFGNTVQGLTIIDTVTPQIIDQI